MVKNPIPYLLVNAFTDRPRKGNPAGVCILNVPVSDEFMQSFATEMGLSATAFVSLSETGAMTLRWFGPKNELKLCGHGTLAAAHALWELGLGASREAIIFHTVAGDLSVHRDGAIIRLDFPNDEPVDVETPAALDAALGTPIVRCLRNKLDYYCILQDEEAVRTLRPDMGMIAALPARGVCVTSRAVDEEFDFVSRFFAPGVGIVEDQVTGSAHCALAPYWAKELGRPALRAFQASPRTGVLDLQVDWDSNRVRVGGAAITVFNGSVSL